MLIVQKYGGATLATPEKVKQVAQRIADLKKSGTQVVAVVSAMGQTTNDLIKLAQQVSTNPSLRELDMLLSVGERTSMALVTMALNDLDCPAISFTGSQAGILTDDSHINANIIDVKAHRVLESLQNDKVVILAGFQGVSPQTKEITTLGRGGSDTTAVAMAAFLKAERCEILKDVEGVMTADPKIISSAQLIQNLSYEQLLEMTFWGAKVLHYKSVQMAQLKNVKLYVGPARVNLNEGTLVQNSDKNSSDNTALAVNSFSHVVKMKTNHSDFPSAKNAFLKLLKSQQIGEPFFLSHETTDSGQIIFYISGPEEILNSISKIKNLTTEFSLVPTDICSVSLTFKKYPKEEFKIKILEFFKNKNMPIEAQPISPLNLNFIIQKNHRTEAMAFLHSLI